MTAAARHEYSLNKQNKYSLLYYMQVSSLLSITKLDIPAQAGTFTEMFKKRKINKQDKNS